MASTTMLERMELVMAWTGWSGREWADKAGLKSDNHVNNHMKRLREKPDATMDAKTAIRLADAADVSLDWFLRGIGVPKIGAETDDPYPTRRAVISGALLAGIERAAIDVVRAESGHDSDPGFDHWIRRLGEAAQRTKLLPPARKRRKSKRSSN